MSLLFAACILLLIGLLLLLAETILPLHGTSATGGIASILLSLVFCFCHGTPAGMGAMTALAILIPVTGFWMIHIWPRTPVGRRLVLQDRRPSTIPAPLRMQVGMTGIALTELKPAGTCEFAGERVPAHADRGLLPAGTPVRIVSTGPTIRVVAR